VDLFAPDPTANLLPCDGIVHYHGRIFTDQEARSYHDALKTGVTWQNDEVMMFGKLIVTARKVAWYGDAGFSYTYSGTTKQALPWTPELRELKAIAEERTGAVFNSCLLNLYHDGREGMGWHSDDEKSLVRDGCIASMSFGAERRFSFRHKRTKGIVSVLLESGSLLVMAGETQSHWHHQLPKSAKVTSPRINLTFRTMVDGRGK
jgi:alkylated DNA repair dioxygenase AlkB